MRLCAAPWTCWRRRSRPEARSSRRSAPPPPSSRRSAPPPPLGAAALLIREGPATELTVATRILAHLGLLAEGGRVAVLVGSEVVYLPGRGATPATMTPYDVAAVRLADGVDLAGAPPEDADRYLSALRADRGAQAAAVTTAGEVVTGRDVVELVERVSGLLWAQAEGGARAAGALVGAYPAEG